MREGSKGFQFFEDHANVNDYISSSIKPSSIQNYFRGDYFQNKVDKEKDKVFFSPRTKEAETNKGKPRLLTGRLPAAFNMRTTEMYSIYFNSQIEIVIMI